MCRSDNMKRAEYTNQISVEYQTFCNFSAIFNADYQNQFDWAKINKLSHGNESKKILVHTLAQSFGTTQLKDKLTKY